VSSSDTSSNTGGSWDIASSSGSSPASDSGQSSNNSSLDVTLSSSSQANAGNQSEDPSCDVSSCICGSLDRTSRSGSPSVNVDDQSKGLSSNIPASGTWPSLDGALRSCSPRASPAVLVLAGAVVTSISAGAMEMRDKQFGICAGHCEYANHAPQLLALAKSDMPYTYLCL
jgi:hypothetical protein